MDSLNLEAERRVAEILGPDDAPVEIVRTSFDRAGEVGDGYLVLTPNRVLIGDRLMSGEIRIDTHPLSALVRVEIQELGLARGSAIFHGDHGPLGSLTFSGFERSRIEGIPALLAELRAPPVAAPVRVAAVRTAHAGGEEDVPMAIVIADAPRRVSAAAPTKGLQIQLEKASYRPGETVRGSLVLGWPVSQVVRGVWWQAAGTESTHVTITTGSGKHRHSTTYRETRALVGCGSLLFGAHKTGFFGLTWEGMKAFVGIRTDNPLLPAGEYGYDFEFTLPADAPPSYAGSNVDVGYAVSARVDIPGGLDLTASATFLVTQEGNYWLRGFEGAHHPGSGLGKLFTADVEMAVEAPDRRFRIGDSIEFLVRVKNLGGKHVRGLNVFLDRNEWARARGHTNTSTRSEKSLNVPAERLALDGSGVPLAIRIPEAFLVYASKISSVTWGLRAQLDIAWGIDASVTASLDVGEERG